VSTTVDLFKKIGWNIWQEKHSSLFVLSDFEAM
jgi:hypothetical protein